MGYLLVVDLEATCWDSENDPQTTDKMEVIEFGCVVSTWGGEILGSFSQLVQPVERPLLTGKCTKLTTITQQMVDEAPVYADAVRVINAKLDASKFDCWLSWGNYDRQQLESHHVRSGISPEFMSVSHVNFRDVYKKHKGSGKKATARSALERCGLSWEGGQHRAEVDALNYARLVPHMAHSIKEILKQGSTARHMNKE